MKPIIEVMTVNFSLLDMDQIGNKKATLLHMSGGQFKYSYNYPNVMWHWETVRGATFTLLGIFCAHFQGLIILALGTHEDARGMVLTALKSATLVILFGYTSMLNT